jgi:hypothetical protein
LTASPPLSISFAIPDHPWVDSENGAAVRVALTIGVSGQVIGRRLTIARETPTDQDETLVVFDAPTTGTVSSDLRTGASPSSAQSLLANARIAYWGVKFYGDGFVLSKAEADELRARQGGRGLARPFVSGRDLVQRSRGLFAIDCDGLDEAGVLRAAPDEYQVLLTKVKPVRAHNPRAFKRERWWIFGENQPGMRTAVRALSRYVATTETASHRVFQFIPGTTVAEGTVAVIATDDALHLGVLSSRVHVVWSLAAGGRLGVGNDPRYNKTKCFDPFPFPCPNDLQARRIRTVAEQIDVHRQSRQQVHPSLTMTGMYNALASLRTGQPLSEKDKALHDAGLVSVLRQLHDDLDAAVFDAYGWPTTLTDEEILEKLVALNAERAAEERTGLVRWLRPEFQNPTGTGAATQGDLAVEADDASEDPTPAAASAAAPWPKKPAEQFVVVRFLLTTNCTAAFSAEAMIDSELAPVDTSYTGRPLNFILRTPATSPSQNRMAASR